MSDTAKHDPIDCDCLRPEVGVMVVRCDTCGLTWAARFESLTETWSDVVEEVRKARWKLELNERARVTSCKCEVCAYGNVGN